MSQFPLFEVGRPSLPPGVTVFASGANEAREIRGFALAGVAIGVAVSLIREEAILELLISSERVFADSGAFSEVKFGANGMSVVAPITDAEWKRRLNIYKRLAESQRSNLSVVAPDRVADQYTTLVRLSCYRTEMAEIADLGAEVLIPVQNGGFSPAEFYRKAIETARLDLVPAFPMKKAASSFADVLTFVQTVRPRRLHLLGMGFELQKARKLVSMLQAVAPNLDISMDSNRLRAVTGQGRTMTVLESRMRAEEPEWAFVGEAESEALEGAERRIDYTDSIAEPSSWATNFQLETIAAVAGLSGDKRKKFLADPDAFLQSPVNEDSDIAWIDFPHISYVLDSAWQSYVAAEHHRSVRTAAVRRTFEVSRIGRNTAA